MPTSPEMEVQRKKSHRHPVPSELVESHSKKKIKVAPLGIPPSIAVSPVIVPPVSTPSAPAPNDKGKAPAKTLVH